jgi:hypothetical protein
VRRHFLLLLWLAATNLTVSAAADEGYAQLRGKPIVVQEFSGSGSTTTGFFKVRDRWEVQWNARQVVSVAVMSSDGTIVAGAAGVLRGSLFIPLGGQYYLKVGDGTVIVPIPKPLPDKASPGDSTNAPSAFGTNGPSSSTIAAALFGTNSPAASTNAAPVMTTNAPAATNAAPTANTNVPAASTNAPPVAETKAAVPEPEVPVSWHLQVIQLSKSVRASASLTVFTPYFSIPDSAITPEPAPPPPPVLTREEAQTVVRIRGDNASGTGFLLRTPEGTFVVTHLHLLAANPNVRIYTTAGAEIPTLALKGAIGRDLAMFSIQDQSFTCLPPCTDPADKIKAGEPLIIPDVAGQAEPMLGTPGRVIGMSDDRVDFDNRMGPDSSGAPVILAKKGTALAVVTAVKKVDVSDLLAAAWPRNPAPGSSGIIPYFGLRLAGVPGWQTYDLQQLLTETTFLKQFHRDTRCLDSFLNGRKHHDPGEDDNSGAPDVHFYLNNSKLRGSFDTYRNFAGGADRSQRMEAAHELLFDLYGITKTDVATLQGMTNLYAYDQGWAKEEMAYRDAIKKELDDLSNDLNRLDEIAKQRLNPEQ